MNDHELLVTRRAALRSLAATLAAVGWSSQASATFPSWMVEEDRRLGELKDLDGYFPFSVPADPQSWAARAEEVRRRILVASGLWPMPTRPALVPVVHGKVERDDHTVERVYFESFPGLYVTGSLYRPKGTSGPFPAVLSPHGHWDQGRFHDHGAQQIEKELAVGAERFEVGGRHPVQARCVHLARMGCVVFLYDMIGYADSAPITFEVAHRFAKQRPELSSPERWGLFSAQAELRLQNVLGLQLWNSIRSLDFLLGLEDVDDSRVGVTGESGGGTQTMILSAVDERPAASFPAVMVSTAMQGGCTCENASYLRVETGNIEFAALCSPRPQGMTGANDWTREIETKGLPELKKLYELMGVPELVEGKYLSFEHNYNGPSRALMYAFFKKHLRLAPDAPLEERDFAPLSREEATVWDDGHPKPPCDADAEVRLLRALDADTITALGGLTPDDGGSLAEYRRVVGGGVEIMAGRKLPPAGAVTYEQRSETDRGTYLETVASLSLASAGEVVPGLFLHPKQWKGRVVLWLDPAGKSSLLTGDGTPIPAVARLLETGAAVGGIDLLGTGEHRQGDQSWDTIRRVENPREFLGYTVGYNHPLFAQRVHDILTLLSFARNHELKPSRVDVVANRGAAHWAAAAGAVAEASVIDAMSVSTGGFRFATLTDIFHPDLWPGAVKYGDLPALLALNAPRFLRVAGEPNQPGVLSACYRAAGVIGRLTTADSDDPDAVVDWLLSI